MWTRRSGTQPFLFEPSADVWLSILRAGVGLVLVCYCFSLSSDWSLLNSSEKDALINRDLSETILSVENSWLPRLGWLVNAARQFQIAEAPTLNAVWLLLLGTGCFLIAGLFSRVSAVTAWFLFFCTAKSGALTSYGMDNATLIGLFYLVLSPLPDRCSLDAKLRRLPAKDPSLHGFHRRVLQCHLCLIYFFSGLTKAFGPDWWDGTSIWRAMTRVPFNVLPANFVASLGPFLPSLGIGVVGLEIGYAFFIWPRRTRRFWLAGILSMHLMIGLAMGLYLFALIMIVLNLAAFGTSLFDEGNRFSFERNPHKLNALDA